MRTDNTELFSAVPIPKAIFALIVPAIFSQIITVVYNMADAFFIGQLGNPDQVATAALLMPLFSLTTGMANLFGIGGRAWLPAAWGRR